MKLSVLAPLALGATILGPSSAFTPNTQVRSVSLAYMNTNIPSFNRRPGGNGITKMNSATTEAPNDTGPLNSDEDESLVAMGSDGLYKIENKQQHAAFLKANHDKIVILKFFAPWCRACKGLEPKFLLVSRDKRYKDLPLVFADFNVQHNREYIKELGILALPNVHIYAGSAGLIENFPCGPSKVPILKRKIAAVVNDRVDAETLQLNILAPGKADCDVDDESEPCKEREVSTTVGDLVISKERLEFIRNEIIYFKDFTDEEFDGLMKKAKLQTFEAGSVIMKQGKVGTKFFIIESGEVEISIKTQFEDPLQTPSNYLGAVINRFSTNDFFGERGLITGEPRAASIRAVEKTRCFAFEQEDIPASSVLSGKKSATLERLAEVNDRYGVDFYDLDDAALDKQVKDSSMMNQSRGSLNRPHTIAYEASEEETFGIVSPPPSSLTEQQRNVMVVLMRFKNIRRAVRCFEYISQTKPRWGDEGENKRRATLVTMLHPKQREDFRAAFEVIDKSKDSIVSLSEMRTFMESVGSAKTDEELMDMINKSSLLVDGNTEITFDEFMGVMAEAEFYYLFKETFNALDTHNSGFVRAGDLDLVLNGMRDLISDDRKSLIDVEDKDMLINYDQFAKMLLGVTL